MAREPSKEATLKEVLAEVSLIDVGRILKGGLATMGCLLVFFAVIGAISTATESAGYGLDDLGVPYWPIWLIFAWAMVHSGTSSTSYHQWIMSWYFPKLGWFSSLLLAAYLLGFVYLVIEVLDLDLGLERTVAAILVWMVYPSPFILFLAVIEAGYAKLMERRLAAAGSAANEDRL